MPIVERWNVAQTTVYDSEPHITEYTDLFYNPLGSKDRLGRVKGQEQTNMVMSGILPCPQKFHIDRLYLALTDLSGKLLPLFEKPWSELAVALFIGDILWASGPAWHFAHSNVVFASLKEPEQEIPDLYAAWKSHRGAPLALWIEAQQWFRVRVTGPVSPVEIKAILDGTLYREVY